MFNHSLTRGALAPMFIAGALLAAPVEGLTQSAERQLDSRAFIDVAHRVLPAVVNISINPKRGQWSNDPEDYDDPLDIFRRPMSVSGSGVVIRVEGQEGYLLTNNHVVDRHDNRTEITLTFHQRPEGSTEYTQTTEVKGDTIVVLGRDELSDLAVVRFQLPDTLSLDPVEFADSDYVEIGEHVMALGNPLDLNHTISQGIISAKSRFLGSHISLERLLQTDATIQQGSSGGPLVNLDGKIVGINNAIASRNGMWQGIGFAIPSNDANRISAQLIDYQRVRRGYLGVNMAHVATKRDLLPHLGLERPEGVYIDNVVSDSPADIAGIHAGDVVIAIDGYPIRSQEEMLRTITSKPVEEEIRIEIVRLDGDLNAERMEVVAVLTERPDEQTLTELHQPERSNAIVPRIQEDPDAPATERNLGMELEPHSNTSERIWGLKVTSVASGSPAARAGLAQGDIITIMNGRAVRTKGDFGVALANPIRGSHIIRFLRDGETRMVTIEESSDARDVLDRLQELGEELMREDMRR